MRVGVEVEFFYSSETTLTEFHYKTKSAFSFKGALEQGRMSGKCKIQTMSFFESGNVITNSSEMLWIAKKQ